MSDHAILAPSSAARRVACPGSCAMEALFPQTEDSPASREGTAAHWVAAEMIKGRSNTLSKIAPNGEIVTDEMIEGALLYAKDVAEVLLKYPNINYVQVESQVSIQSIHPECSGTPDAWLATTGINCDQAPRVGVLYVWDYKFGHTPVDAYENWQLIEYTAGILDYAYPPGADVLVHLRVVQPRDYQSGEQIKEWVISRRELEPYFDTLRKAEAAAMEPGASCTPSPECNHCLARHACPALASVALTAVDVSKGPQPWELNATKVGYELRYLERAAALLKARITGLQEQAQSMIESGNRVPFYRLEPGKPRECWNAPAEEIIALGDLMGRKLTAAPKLITPKQAISEGLPADLVRKYSTTPTGTPKLVQEDIKKIKKMFDRKVKLD